MASISVESIDQLIASTGKELAKSDWLEITQSMVDNFADVTGDRNGFILIRKRRRLNHLLAERLHTVFLRLR